MQFSLRIDTHVYVAVKKYTTAATVQAETIRAKNSEWPLSVDGLVACYDRIAHVDIGGRSVHLVSAVGINGYCPVQQKTSVLGIQQSPSSLCADPCAILERDVSLYVPERCALGVILVLNCFVGGDQIGITLVIASGKTGFEHSEIVIDDAETLERHGNVPASILSRLKRIYKNDGNYGHSGNR